MTLPAKITDAAERARASIKEAIGIVAGIPSKSDEAPAETEGSPSAPAKDASRPAVSAAGPAGSRKGRRA